MILNITKCHSACLYVNRLWRIFVTGCCFAIFAIGGLLLSFILIPIMQLFVHSAIQRERKTQAMIQFFFHCFCQLMRCSSVLDYQMSGFEALRHIQQNRESKRGGIIVANHPSLIDYVLIASQLKQCDCLVKASLWQNPFIGKIIRSAGFIPNHTADDLFNRCEEKFQQGHWILIFPEGTRTPTHILNHDFSQTKENNALKLQRGAAQVALRSQVDIIVINIAINAPFLTKELKWYQVPKIKPFFHLAVKDRISYDFFVKNTNKSVPTARDINNYLSQVLFPDNTISK